MNFLRSSLNKIKKFFLMNSNNLRYLVRLQHEKTFKQTDLNIGSKGFSTTTSGPSEGINSNKVARLRSPCGHMFLCL